MFVAQKTSSGESSVGATCWVRTNPTLSCRTRCGIQCRATTNNEQRLTNSVLIFHRQILPFSTRPWAGQDDCDEIPIHKSQISNRYSLIAVRYSITTRPRLTNND
jgi:hypothetical protein